MIFEKKPNKPYIPIKDMQQTEITEMLTTISTANEIC